jgi:hypothetical protein
VTIRRTLLVALAALSVAVTAGGVSYAAFSGTTSNSGNSFSAATDFVAPSASVSVIMRNGATVPGVVGLNSSYHVYANVSDTGNPASGVSSVTANTSSFDSGVAAANMSAGSWTVAGQPYNRRSAALTSNGANPDGTYAYSLGLTDNASNNRTQTGLTVGVDGTRPTGTDIQAVNGGSVNRVDAGDQVAFTFSEPMEPTSIKAGWNGASTAITVTVTSANPSILSTDVNLGSVNLVRRYFNNPNATFPATMVMSGSTVTVTLGAQSAGGTTRSNSQNTTLAWTPVNSATDIAGNTMQTATVSEAGANDPDF